MMPECKYKLIAQNINNILKANITPSQAIMLF